jgi:hypothetical protein
LSTHLFITWYLAELEIINKPSPVTRGMRTNTVLHVPRWEPPEEGTLKVNVDGPVARSRRLCLIAKVWWMIFSEELVENMRTSQGRFALLFMRKEKVILKLIQ